MVNDSEDLSAGDMFSGDLSRTVKKGIKGQNV